jgi:uncharacterized iron-regulated membrane protein
VVAATVCALVIQLSGLFLWWRSKIIAVRAGVGWRRAVDDLHHSSGALGLPLMVLLALSGVSIAFVIPQSYPALRRTIFDLHTTRGFSLPVRIIYAAASACFAIQGMSGVAMWWKPKSRTRRRSPATDAVSRGAP